MAAETFPENHHRVTYHPTNHRPNPHPIHEPLWVDRTRRSRPSCSAQHHHQEQQWQQGGHRDRELKARDIAFVGFTHFYALSFDDRLTRRH